ncbi:MAG TPA: hypothetical protein VHA82_14260 [Ramlibacter sp.]|uniref:hypothetical protein n=1 Tax=Ramlibacter sp. TaxID=1917967 RepID=UPI002CB9A17D|nr:hypothetical protein [Ramlibacter sp.]HVZ44971.1 hypothetical protein [Ramlibacter sp.]
MKAYHSDYDIDRFPLASAVARAVVGIGVASIYVACWATAGPGNWAADPWAGADIARVTLPQVTVVGRQDGGPVASVTCAKGA